MNELGLHSARKHSARGIDRINSIIRRFRRLFLVAGVELFVISLNTAYLSSVTGVGPYFYIQGFSYLNVLTIMPKYFEILEDNRAASSR